MKNRLFLIFLFVVVLLSSCKVFYPSRMLRTGAGYKFSELPADQIKAEYKIAPNDELSFSLSTNDGEKLINPVSEGGSAAAGQSSSMTYLVEFDGQINFPVLGRTPISGLTLREAETFLEEKFSKYYNNPFIQLKVANNRVIIFPGGEGSSATVLNLTNTNTTLFEALALAGGISDGKAYRIKLIRGGIDNPQIYLFDLSTIEGMKQGNTVMQANDVIYIEPLNKVPEKFMTTVAPYLSLFSTILLIYTLFK
jgi:polysaccharide biosynthesis/export protein